MSMCGGCNMKPEHITYPHECASQIAEIVNLDELSKLQITFNERHKTLFERANRVDVLESFARRCQCPELRARVEEAVHTRQHDIIAKLNEPTFRCFEFLEDAKIPPKGSRIFTTNATADSHNMNAVAAALHIIGVYDDYVWENTSNVNKTGFTGVSCKKPLYTPVYFDAHTPLEQWHELSWDMAQQMFEISNREYERYDVIYHWGCISQNWTRNPLGNYVSNWRLHERWNHVATIAMIWHGVATLKRGGQLMLKVRIWRSPIIMAICALLAPMFQSYSIIENAKQKCSFATVTYNGYDPTHRATVLDIVKESMRYNLSDVFGNSWYVSNIEQCKTFMQRAEVISHVMMRSRAITQTAFLVSLYAINQAWRKKQRRVLFQIVKPMLEDTYGADFGNHLFSEILRIESNMTYEEHARLDLVMSSNWMYDNV